MKIKSTQLRWIGIPGRAFSAIQEQKRAVNTEKEMAEGQGFEPWDGRPSPVFKTGAFDHSATPPEKPEIIPRFVSETSVFLKKTYKSDGCG